jgi:hypothetical protein
MPNRHDFLCPSDTFEYHRLAGEMPGADDTAIDIALLDMNHSWPNLGHDSVVQIVREASDRLADTLRAAGYRIRVLSFDVRRRLLVPEHQSGRFQLYVGTGGPGHLDPRRNDGVYAGSQGIAEDPAWEAPLFRLFDDVMADQNAGLMAICHSFGLMCRWSGIAEAKLRGPEKGGKSSGLVEAILSDEAMQHPWFRQFSEKVGSNRFKVLDNRLYDLTPTSSSFGGATPIAFATLNGEEDSESLTMLEFARDAGGEMPRVFAVNHHPEIIDRPHLLRVLNEKLDRGEVSREWYDERANLFEDGTLAPSAEKDLRVSSLFTFIGPLEFHLQRIVRDRLGAVAPA